MKLNNVWSDINILWSQTASPSDGAIQSATHLLERLKLPHQIPTDANRGYWPTMSFWWDEQHIEVEVFESSYELLIYDPNAEKPLFDIEEYDKDDAEAFATLLNRISELLDARERAVRT